MYCLGKIVSPVRPIRGIKIGAKDDAINTCAEAGVIGPAKVLERNSVGKSKMAKQERETSTGRTGHNTAS